jgi:hypothetical protein
MTEARPSITDCSIQELMRLTDAMHYGGDRADTRRALVFAAGVANNRRLLSDMGSQESSTWYEGRRAADPSFANPYWPQRG